MSIRTELTKAMLVYSPSQHQLYHRPFQMDFDSHGLDRVLSATEGGKLVNPYALSSVASSIITPSATPGHNVNIDGGFGQDRFAFILEFTTTSIAGTSKEIISGFTNYDGALASGALDHNMIFYVNDKITLREMVTASNGRQVRVQEASAVFNPITDYSWQRPTSLRPSDVARNLQANTLTNSYDENTLIVEDIRTSMTTGVKTVDKLDHIPNRYLSKIFNSLMSGLEGEALYGGNDQGRVFDNAIGQMRDESLGSSNFVNAMGERNSDEYGVFTLGELLSVWPRTNDFFMVSSPKFNNKPIVSPIGLSDHWGGTSQEKIIAYALSHSVPALMSRLMTIGIDFMATNENMMGDVEVKLLNAVPFSDGLITEQQIGMIERAIAQDIIIPVVLNKCDSFRILVNAAITGSCSFSISVNGGVAIPLSAPLYCSSYSSPMISGNIEDLNRIADGVEVITDSLFRAKGGYDMGFNAGPSGPTFMDDVPPPLEDNWYHDADVEVTTLNSRGI